MSTTNQRDYYDVLGVGDKASQQEIREAYRKLAFQYHPDRNKDASGATERMKAINEAYATLSNPTKRGEYDALKQRYGPAAYDRFRQTHSQEDIFRGSDIDQVFQEFAKSFGFRDANEIFREFYGPGFRAYHFGRPGFSFRRYVYSPAQGSQSGARQQPAVVQSGLAGKALKFLLEKVLKVQIPERGRDIVDTLHLTERTISVGGEVEYGYRVSGKSRKLAVKIPAGIRSGQTIRLRGIGSPGKAGGPPGDLLLRVVVRVPLSQKIRLFFKGK